MFDTYQLIEPMNPMKAGDVIEGLIPSRGISIMFGKASAGKTSLALSMAMHVSAGASWAGRAVRQGCVIYVCGEGMHTLKIQLAAMRKEYEIALSPETFKIVPRAVNFTDRDAVDSLIRAIQNSLNGEPVAMVVIDPLDLAIPEPDKSDVAVEMLELLRDKLRCAVLLTHQDGKHPSKAIRGASFLAGVVDSYFVVKSKNLMATLHTGKHRHWGTATKPLSFYMKRVVMPGGANGVVPVYDDLLTD